MTEKQFIEVLKNIKEYCSKTEECFSCPFKKPSFCQLRLLASELYTTPTNWDIEKIEELINE